MNVSDLIEPERSREIFKTLLAKPFPLIDLSQIQDEELRARMQHRISGLALLMALKHTFDKNITQFCTSVLIVIWKQMDRTGGRDELVDIIFYYLNEAPFLDKKALLSTIHNELSKETEGELMTIMQRERAEGKQEGKQEGMQTTIMVIRMLKDGEDTTAIIALTGLTAEEVEHIKESIMN